MLKNQRQNEIIEILKQERFVTVSELATRLYASQPTVRRDLDSLEKQGLVRRSHGGAIAADERSHLPVSFRSGTNIAEKLRICRTAVSLITAGSLVFTDASTTALQLADCLNESDGHCIVTNGLLACRRFFEKGISVCSTGGRLLGDSLAFVGETARQTVAHYNADFLFFSSSSLGDNGMISDYSEEETELRRCMSEHSAVRVFLCDSAKFRSRSAYKLFSISSVDYVVTGEALPDNMLSECSLKLLSSGEAYLYGKNPTGLFRTES